MKPWLAACLLLMLLSGCERAGTLRRLQDESSMRCTSRVSTVGYRKKPGCAELETAGGITAEMRYNRQGLRDREYSSKPAPGTFRILLLGSSYLTAPGIPEPKMPSRQLERELSRRIKRKVEVVNGGVPGYGAIQNAILLPEYLAAYNPHIVLYHLTAKNEIFADAAKISATELDAAGHPVAMHFQPLLPMPASFYSEPGWKREILQLNFLLMREWSFTAASWSINPPWRRPEAAAEHLMAATVSMLDSMHRRTANRKIPFRVIWTENRSDTDQNVLSDRDYKVADFFQRYLIRRIDLQAQLLTRVMEAKNIPLLPLWHPQLIDPSLRLQDGLHWNELTAALFARLLATELAERRELLP